MFWIDGYRKEPFIIVAIVLFLVILVSLLSPPRTVIPKTPQPAWKALQVLEKECSLFDVMPGTTRMSYEASTRTSNALVTAGYAANQNYSEIRSFYLNEATRLGWVLIKAGTFEGAYPGERMIFQKGDYKLEIACYLKNKASGSNLVLSFSYNL